MSLLQALHGRFGTASAAFVAALSLSGCGMTASKSVTPPPITPASSITGRVMGGQQPVAGVTLQMYLTGTAYGAAAQPLGASTQTTAAGNFNLSAFTCPATNQQMFLVGTGGTPIGGTANSNLKLMVGLGPCNANYPGFINLNELTTVATVYALSGFMTGPANIGAPASNTQGLTNAFVAINKLVDVATGQVSGPALPAGATLPATEINALGNILQNCVNSGGGSASDTTDGLTNGTPCGKLFYLTNTGTAPTDTVTATLNIAQNPGLNVAKLNALQASSPAFSPALSVNASPAAWTIAISYTGGGLNTPTAIANDANGNVWVANGGNSSVTELNNSGSAVSPSSGFTAGGIDSPNSIAVDQAGSVWVTNTGNNSLTKLASTGLTGAAYFNNGLDAPAGVAIDGAGNAFVANRGGNSISAFDTNGNPLANSPYTGGDQMSPAAIAINPK